MLGANAVMGAVEPSFQIREDKVDHRHELFGYIGIATFGNGVMIVAQLSEIAVTAPVVADDQCVRHDGALDEPAQRVGTTVGHYGQSDPPGATTILALILRCAGYAVADFDGGGHKRFVMDTAPFSARLAADPGFIDLYMVRGLPADSVLVWTNHACAKFMEYLEGGFVARQAKLALKLNGRHAGRLAGEQIRGPEPSAESHMATLHHRSDRQAGVLSTGPTPQDTGAVLEAKWLSDDAAMGAKEAIIPSEFFQVYPDSVGRRKTVLAW